MYNIKFFFNIIKLKGWNYIYYLFFLLCNVGLSNQNPSRFSRRQNEVIKYIFSLKKSLTVNY